MTPCETGGAPQEDAAILDWLEGAILNRCKGMETFKKLFTQLLRDSIDSVIDAPHTGRFRIHEIEKTEKTYLGTKIEIRFRHLLDVSRGYVLDLNIDGVEVDVKNTVATNWTIPPEAMGHPCVLISSDEQRAVCSLGLLVIREDCLNPGKNRDQKSSISRVGLSRVRWLLRNNPYPKNFWETIDEATLQGIVSAGRGTKRLAALFRLVQGKPITRSIVEALGQQKDSLKRLRKNGGARDQLIEEGIALLWGEKDRALVKRLQLPECSRDEFISFKPELDEDIQLLRDAGHL